MMRHKLLVASFVVLGAAVLAAPARAQTRYNLDGTPVPDGGVFDDGRPSGTGAVAYSDGEPQQADERYDIDCDPDIDNCVDPNAQAAYDDGYDPSAYQQFESALSPYGNWSEDPSYGQVWTPSPEQVGYDFMPYGSGGQWIASSDYGFAWASDYDWGWAPFHYGRWLFLSSCGGWSWIPGSLWGPAWVDWRYGGGYVGWAPMAPHGVLVGQPRNSLGTRSPWRFAVATEITHRNPTFVPSHVAATIFGRTAPVRNTRMISQGGVSTRISMGPPLTTVARDLGRPVPALGLRNSAPSVLPHQGIVARPGVALAQRGYVQSARGGRVGEHVVGGQPVSHDGNPHYGNNVQPGRPAQQGYAQPYRAPAQEGYGTSRPPSSYNQPAYRAPSQSYTAPSYRAPSYTQPAYRAPVQTYSPPTYHVPAQTYSPPSYAQPAYRAPVQTYSPPAYHAPAQTYSPPAYHPSAPSYSPPPASHAPAMSAPAMSSPTRRRH